MALITSGVRDKALWSLDPGTPSFVFVGSATSFIPHDAYPWPVDMLKRIRLIDPGFVPVCLRRVYRTQAHGRLTFFHHGIARYDRHAEPDRRLDSAPRPVHDYFSRFPYGLRPNVIDLWFTGMIRPSSIRHRAALPGPFIPWSEWVERTVRENAWLTQQRSQAERKARIDAEREAEVQAEVAAAIAESDYIDRQEASCRRDLVSSITPADERDNEGRWLGVVKPPTRPSVHVRTRGEAA